MILLTFSFMGSQFASKGFASKFAVLNSSLVLHTHSQRGRLRRLWMFTIEYLLQNMKVFPLDVSSEAQ